MTFVGPLIGRGPGVRQLYRPAYSPARGERVPWLLGAALAVRREAFDAVGGFDERFFMYSEEVDLCYRLVQAGWDVRFTPLAEVVHAGGASTGQDRVAMEVERYAATRRFYRKHYSRAARRMLVALTTYRMLHNLARDRGRIAVARRGHERDALAERISVWRRVLAAAWET
jgi:GT2 family glycosyltransferase